MKILFFTFIITLLLVSVSGHAKYVPEIPNGAAIVVNGKPIAAIGHINVKGGGTRTS